MDTSFLFLATYFPGGYALAEALAERYATHTVCFCDWPNYRRLRPTWPSTTPPSLLQRSRCVLPPGYAGQLEQVFRSYLQRQIKRWCRQLEKTSGTHPWVVATYPYLAPWVRNVPEERLVYYNIDNYVLYRPSREQKILEQEEELIERAALTLCLSRFQVQALQKRYPNKAEYIHHYPLGVIDSYLNPQTEKGSGVREQGLGSREQGAGEERKNLAPLSGLEPLSLDTEKQKILCFDPRSARNKNAFVKSSAFDYEDSLTPAPRSLIPLSVGYVGNLTERVDWQLIYQVAQACLEITFIFVGGLDDNACGIGRQDWQADRDAVLALPNVRHVAKVPQAQVAQYYWSFAVNWIPYVAIDPFNQASCPTKIMDGIASGRPILSTDIPECRLYPEWITIFHSAAEAIAQLRQQLAVVELEARKKSSKQLEFARQHTWSIRAHILENLLLRRDQGSGVRGQGKTQRKGQGKTQRRE